MGSYKIINNLLATMVPNSGKKSTHRGEVGGHGPFQKLIILWVFLQWRLRIDMNSLLMQLSFTTMMGLPNNNYNDSDWFYFKNLCYLKLFWQNERKTPSCKLIHCYWYHSSYFNIVHIVNIGGKTWPYAFWFWCHMGWNQKFGENFYLLKVSLRIW